jgi:hypothetical protein
MPIEIDDGGTEGRPSRWNTLRALRVLRWYSGRYPLKRRPMLVVGGTLASAILLWLTLREPRPANDDARYQVWLEGPTTYNRIVDFQKHLSPRTSRLLGLYYLKQRSLAGHESLG